MKKLIFILFLIFLFSYCKKENYKKADYRDPFIGDFKCQKVGLYYCYSNVLNNYDTTIIINVKKSGDSLINVLGAKLKIRNNGVFGGGLYPDSAYHSFSGYFKQDSIYFNTYQGGIGCYTSLSYKGEKL